MGPLLGAADKMFLEVEGRGIKQDLISKVGQFKFANVTNYLLVCSIKSSTELLLY